MFVTRLCYCIVSIMHIQWIYIHKIEKKITVQSMSIIIVNRMAAKYIYICMHGNVAISF